MADHEESLHWLVRPATIRKLWYGFSTALIVVVLLQGVIYIKGYFGVDGWLGFGAIYGFISCLLMVLAAKFLGLFIKRPDNFYTDRDGGPGADASTNRAEESSNAL